MSQILQDLKNLPDTALGATDKNFIDADTLVDSSGQKYRIQGIDAAEVAKVTNGQVKAGTAGGQASTDVIRELANKQGYTNIAPVLDANGNPQVDQFGRALVDLRDEAGNSFNKQLLDAGAFDINEYATGQQIASRDINRARRERDQLAGTYEETAFDQAADMINAAELAEGEKQLGFKRTALNEAERAVYQQAGMGHLLTDDVQIRNRGVDLNNNSLNPMSDAWDMGWQGAKEGMYGMMNLLGEEFNNEWLADVGEDGIARMQARQAEMGQILTDWKDVDGISTGLQFLGNNIAMSLPYMAITAAGAGAAGAATAATGGGAAFALGAAAVGAAPSASVYAGQVWNEMEGEKDAGVAVTAGIVQAGLDRLGLGGIAGKLVPDRAVQQGVQHIMRAKGLSKEAAEQMLANATKAESRLLLQDAVKTASRKQAAKAAGKDLIKRAAIEGAFEGGTEVLQEATAYTAATMGSDKEFDWEELNERMVAAAIAGGAIGSAISTPGAMKQSLNEYDLLSGAQQARDDTASQAAIYADEEKAELGYTRSIGEITADARARAASGGGFESQQDRAARYNQKQKDKGFTQRAAEAALNPAALWRGATRNIFTPELQAKSKTARAMASMFGGNLQQIHSGASFETDKFQRVATYKNMVDMPDTYWRALGEGKALNRSQKDAISNDLYDMANKYKDKDGNFNPNLIPDTYKHKQTMLRLNNQLKSMADKMYNDQKKHNPELGYTKDYLFKYKSLSKQAVAKNRKGFEQALVKNGYKPADAQKLTDEIIQNNEVFDVDEAFSVIRGGIHPQSHKKRQLGMSEKKEFQDFMEQDIFANVAQAAKSAARYTAHRDFIGKNGSVVSQLLDDMEKEGVPPAEVDKVAAQLQDYLDAESGNYKRPKTDAGKKAQEIQKNLMLAMTLSGLPLATISSFVELMLVNRGLTSGQVWGQNGIKAQGKELGRTLLNGMKNVAEVGTGQDYDTDPKSEARQKLREAGFYEWDVGAATATGVTEVSATKQRWVEFFFKWNGLTGWTNYTRAARASIAGDYMSDNAEIIWRNKGNPDTRDVQQAKEKLRNLGLDPEGFADLQMKVYADLPLTPQEEASLGEQMKLANFNFVNEAVALPQSANRPLIYQDPRFALFTQFQGFIATFTANHIPKLWGEYVKRGTPTMKYNAFATMATMIMMGFASQHLKDIVKYTGDDEEDKTGLNPYLDTPEYVRRGLMASGLLGTSERLINAAFPIYESRSDGPVDWLFNQATGESPALGYAQRLGNAAGYAAAGEGQKAINQLAKAAPGIGPFSSFNKALSHGLTGDWEYFKE